MKSSMVPTTHRSQWGHRSSYTMADSIAAPGRPARLRCEPGGTYVAWYCISRSRLRAYDSADARGNNWARRRCDDVATIVPSLSE